MTSIYALCDPDGDTRYIGKADNPKKRLKAHHQPYQLRARTHKNSWIKHLLARGELPVMRILEEVPVEEWRDKERAWIARALAAGCDLVNGTSGGDGYPELSPESRARQAASLRGRKASAETRARMSASAKLRAADPVERERLRSISNGTPPVNRGEANGFARFNEADVLAMRERAAKGERLCVIAVDYLTSQTEVSLIVTGETWAHVGGPTRKAAKRQRLSPGDVAEIRRLVGTGLSQREVARQFGVDASHVSRILRDERRKAQ